MKSPRANAALCVTLMCWATTGCPANPGGYGCQTGEDCAQGFECQGGQCGRACGLPCGPTEVCHDGVCQLAPGMTGGSTSGGGTVANKVWTVRPLMAWDSRDTVSRA